MCHFVDNNVIYESDIQGMRQITIESGAHRVTELMDLPQGRVLDLGEGKEDEDDEDLRLPYLPKQVFRDRV